MIDELVMIVEDDDIDREVLAYALTKQEQNEMILWADSVPDALTILRKRVTDGKPLPDIIFLDLLLPGTSGVELLKIMKTDATLSHIYVVVWTAYRGDVGALLDGYGVTVDQVEKKSDDPHDILTSLQSCMSQFRRQRRVQNEAIS